MNSRNRWILTAMIVVVSAACIMWGATGFRFFTATQVPVEHVDPFFGTKSVEWKHTFVLGLDMVIGVFIVTLVSGGAIMFLSRKKNRT